MERRYFFEYKYENTDLNEGTPDIFWVVAENLRDAERMVSDQPRTSGEWVLLDTKELHEESEYYYEEQQ